jgi:hypothetical protein
VTPGVGFLNGDRWPDLVVGSAHGMRILFGRGDGRFRIGSVEFGSSAATSVAVADFNNDKLADVALGTPPDLSILLGDGRGGFMSANMFPLDYVWIASAVADFNRDGRDDVALLGQDLQQAVHLDVLLGTGAGQLIRAPGSPQPTNDAVSLTAGDLNADGAADLLINVMFGDEVDVLLARGDGSFQSGPGAAPPERGATSAAFGDFNEDGRLDLVQGSTSWLRVRTGDGRGAFGPTTAKLRWPWRWRLAAADFNHDHHLDVATAGNSDDVRVAWGDGTGALATTPRTKLEVPGEIDRVVTADFNRDGRGDLAVVSTRPRARASRLTVFLARRRRAGCT